MRYLKLFENFESKSTLGVVLEHKLLRDEEKYSWWISNYQEFLNAVDRIPYEDWSVLVKNPNDFNGVYNSTNKHRALYLLYTYSISELNEMIDTYSEELEDLDESKKSGVTASLKKKSKASGIPVGILRKVFSRGMQAWNAGHRPGVAQHQWGLGRVNSFITGSGGARKADTDLWKKAKAAKARKKKD